MRPARDGTPAPPAGRECRVASRGRLPPSARVGPVAGQDGQQTVGLEPEADAFALGQATPDAVPFAVPDGVEGALADHRAASADRLRACLAGGPLGTPFTVGRKEDRAVDVPAGGPQPPRPQPRPTHVLKGFLPSIHVGSSQRRPHRPVSAQAKAPTSQVIRQQIAPWAGFILSRPGEVWVPGTSIPGEAGSQPGPLLVNLCGRPETAGFSHPHRWTSDGCQPALLPRDTTTLYRDDRRELAATADRRATCGTPPRAVYTAKEAKRLRLGLRDHRRLVQAATWVPARAPGRR